MAEMSQPPTDQARTPSVLSDIGRVRTVGTAALALWAQAEAHRLAAEFDRVGVPVLLLKGPDLQARLYGTPAAYPSSDVDVLVKRKQVRVARATLERSGWSFEPDNGVLWRFSRAASFERAGFRVDLHWGLHAAHLPAWSLQPLERRLWTGAQRGRSGMLESDAESLLVYLAVHVVGHGFERPQWTENVRRAAALVEDWDEVWRVARRAHVEGAVRAALDGRASGARVAILDGTWGRVVSGMSWLTRGHFIPLSIRDRVRDAVALGREGFGFVGIGSGRIRTISGLDLVVPPGVFRPWALTEELAVAGLSAIEGLRSPVIVDVGTGCGAVALSIANERSDAEVHGTDTSARAIRAARRNGRRVGLRHARFHRGSLLGPLPTELRGRVSAIVTNLPADPPATTLELSPAEEPRRSLVGPGADGLDLMRALALEAREFLGPGGRLLLMLLDWQSEILLAELRTMGYEASGVMPSRRTDHRFCSAEWRGSTS